MSNPIENNFNFKLEQILPDVFYEDIKLKEAVCVKISKKKTGLVIDFLKQNNLNNDKIYLKNENKTIESDYKVGTFTNKTEEYINFDISFIKRVKPLDNENNLILIGFTEHLEYINQDTLTKLELFLKEKELFIDNKYILKQIPYIQPLNEEQFTKCKAYWHISYLPTSTSKIVYTHKPEELEEFQKIIEILLSKKDNTSSILYNPNTKKIIEKAEGDDSDSLLNFNPISHSILKLINKFSEKLTTLQEPRLGEKSIKSPFIEYLDDYEEQYYLENHYVFTLKEPCMMCAMALVHSRAARVYFVNENKEDGAFQTKLKINNYNLNHNYSIFKINI